MMERRRVAEHSISADSGHELARIEDAQRIERSLDPAVSLQCALSDGVGKPAPLSQADAMLPGDGSAHGKHLVKKLVQGVLGALPLLGIVHVGYHDVDMNVSVTRMAEA